MIQSELIATAKRLAVQHGLDPVLVCAVCEQESAWETFAIRFEPGFYSRYVAPQNLPSPTEANARAFSWGLMQVMGQVARETGYKVRYLSELCDPEIGIDVGCIVLKGKLASVGGDVRKGLLRYNGGGRPAYAGEVIARMEKYR